MVACRVEGVEIVAVLSEERDELLAGATIAAEVLAVELDHYRFRNAVGEEWSGCAKNGEFTALAIHLHDCDRRRRKALDKRWKRFLGDLYGGCIIPLAHMVECGATDPLLCKRDGSVLVSERKAVA